MGQSIMPLTHEDRQKLARIASGIGKRVESKEAQKRLAALTNKLAHGNILVPDDKEFLTFILQGLTTAPRPTIKSGNTWMDYLLVWPAFKKTRAVKQVNKKVTAERGRLLDIQKRLAE